jgi:hypothetical protein
VCCARTRGVPPAADCRPQRWDREGLEVGVEKLKVDVRKEALALRRVS